MREGDQSHIDGCGDRGSASLWAVGLGLAVLVLAGAVVVAGERVIAEHRARNAADLGALAGVARLDEGVKAACGVAGLIVLENRARMVECWTAGRDLVVTVSVTVKGSPSEVRTTARAGPVRR